MISIGNVFTLRTVPVVIVCETSGRWHLSSRGGCETTVAIDAA
jgi:hypothetical protein